MTGNTPSVKTDWHHKWCTLKNIYIHEVVKGPLYRPMVAIPLSNTHVEHATQCECAGKVKEFYVQKGIPDPQEDVWILKEELKRGRSSAEAYPKRDADITNSLRRKYCVYLGQGIPDPWKTKIMLDNGRDEGPSRGMMRGLFNFERINCPECGAQITILCLKEEGEEKDEHVQKNCEDEDDDDDDDDDEDVKPEKPTKHKVEFKDACVETDQCSNATIHETESSHHKHKVHETESIMHKPRICETESTHSKVKLTEKEEPNCKSASQITCNYPILKVGSAYKKESQISNLSQGCPAHNKTPPLVQSQNSCNIGSPSPTVIPHVLSSIRRKDLSDTNRSAQIQTVNNQSPVLPFVYNNTNCPCHQQLIGFEEKNDHFMEMKLVCAKCEMTKEEKRRKKKKRKHKKKEEAQPSSSQQVCYLDGRCDTEERTCYHCIFRKDKPNPLLTDISKFMQLLNEKKKSFTRTGIDDMYREKFTFSDDKRRPNLLQSQRDYSHLLHIPGLKQSHHELRTTPSTGLAKTSTFYPSNAFMNWKQNNPQLKTDVSRFSSKTDQRENNSTYEFDKEWLDQVYNRCMGSTQERENNSRLSSKSMHRRLELSNNSVKEVNYRSQSRNKFYKHPFNEDFVNLPKLKGELFSSQSPVNVEDEININNPRQVLISPRKQISSRGSSHISKVSFKC